MNERCTSLLPLALHRAGTGQVISSPNCLPGGDYGHTLDDTVCDKFFPRLKIDPCNSSEPNQESQGKGMVNI